jgi:hypothetical protein
MATKDAMDRAKEFVDVFGAPIPMLSVAAAAKAIDAAVAEALEGSTIPRLAETCDACEKKGANLARLELLALVQEVEVELDADGDTAYANFARGLFSAMRLRCEDAGCKP